MKAFNLTVVCCAFMGLIPLQGQETAPEIINLPEVVVRESNTRFFSDDQTTIRLDETSFTVNKQETLGAILSIGSPSLVRDYGSSGSLASLSLHGTGANHAVVSWNGFPLNSPTTGQADLSLIPFGFVQSVSIVNGASGALHGSGTFGGLVELANEPEWNDAFNLHISGDAGSFGTKGFFTHLQSGGRIFQYQLSLMDRQAKNDFNYSDVYRYRVPEITAEHNSFRSRGIIQNIYVNAGHGNFIETGLWFQHKFNEIPALMGSYKSGNAEQRDKNFRAYLNYSKAFDHSTLLVKNAYLTDHLRYTDKVNTTDDQYSINSNIEAGRFMTGIDYRYLLTPSITAGTGGAFTTIHAITNNYSLPVNEQEYALYASLKISWAEWILNTSLRQEFYEDLNPVPQFSLGVRRKIGNLVTVRANFSSKFRKPTLNEKYWDPGGNPGLRPERGWGGDLSTAFQLMANEDRTVYLNALATFYYQHVDNWIQWIAGDSLTPVEYKEVHAKGVETVIDFQFPVVQQFQLAGKVNYGCNFSTIASTYDQNKLLTGNQLIYIPRHIIRANLVFRGYGFMMGMNGSWTGARETVESGDAMARLSPYHLLDILAGYAWIISDVHMEVQLRLENLLNESYEVMRSYPMPGRSWNITLSFDI